MKMTFFSKVLLTGVAMVALVPAAFAQSRVDGTDYLAKERFQVRARALGVIAQESSDMNTGGKISVGDAVTPELDLTYYFTDHISAEAIAGTARHQLAYNNSTKMGEAWILPPSVTLQYHFTPDKKFSPYVGAGLNYSIFYGEKSNNFTDLNVDNGMGYVMQAGADYWLNDNWGVNFDVKKILLNVDASVNNGTVAGDVDIDPWLIGAGVSYRF
jgi:outer membrane protein